MCLPARLFGPDGEEIVDLDSWFVHAPPEKGLAQWKDGFSAKEAGEGMAPIRPTANAARALVCCVGAGA
jgi:hypothetical protein